ncbi:hypothetical protein KM043_014773 [Ampulex compressa]|nr:hypothetical protein KM043_014773 [Ampulex compressa]
MVQDNNCIVTTVKDDGKEPPSEDVEKSSESIKLEKPANEEELKRLLDDAATFSDANDKSWATAPYPKEVQIPDALLDNPEKPKVDPAETSVLLFPGQGILKGPQQKLDQTQFNQPATVVTCLAALEKIREEMPNVFKNCATAAGYSVGELTALIFSGAISIEDGIRLVAVRAAAMQYAANLTPQGMMTVQCRPYSKLSVGCDEARKWALDAGITDPVCNVAIYLYTESKILAGNLNALEYLQKNKDKFKLHGLKRLPVSECVFRYCIELPSDFLRHTVNKYQFWNTANCMASRAASKTIKGMIPVGVTTFWI